MATLRLKYRFRRVGMYADLLLNVKTFPSYRR